MWSEWRPASNAVVRGEVLAEIRKSMELWVVCSFGITKCSRYRRRGYRAEGTE
jgi:hypothetical protein